MQKSDKQTARAYLKGRGLKQNALDIIEAAEDSAPTKDVYINSTSSCLVMIQEFSEVNTPIHADTYEDLLDCLKWLPSTSNMTFRVNEQWLADALQALRGYGM